MNDVVEIRQRLCSRSSFHLTNIDPREGEYLQKHPSIHGPDKNMNRSLRRKVGDLSSWVVRTSATPTELIDCAPFNLGSLEDCDVDVFKSAGAPHSEVANHFWKLMIIRNKLRQASTKLLCVGAGNGLECRIARLISPEVEIVGTDYDVSASAYGANLLEVPHSELAKVFHPEMFEVIYSNHALEHLYDDLGPVLQNIYKVLKTGGCFISALPCEANPSNPAREKFLELVSKNCPFSYLDVDPGHPWKTDVFDIYDKLTGAGFKHVKFFYLKGSYEDNKQVVLSHIRDRIGVPSEAQDPAGAASPPGPGLPLSGVRRRLAQLGRFLQHLAATRSLFESRLKIYYSRMSGAHDKNRRVSEIVFTCSK